MRFRFAGLFLFVACAACGLDFDSFGFESGTGGAGATGGSTSTGGDGGVASTGGSGGVGGTATGTAGMGGTGGTPAGTGAAGGTGGTGGAPPTGIPCPDMNSLCDIDAGSACCWDNGNEVATCEASGNCGGDTIIGCTGPADCPGQECCGDFSFGQDPQYDELICKNNCGSDVTICDSQADCGPGQDCVQSDFLPNGITVCRFD